MLKEFNRIFAEHQTVGELEIYDTGMINNVAFMNKRGDLKSPIYMQWVMGILGGIGATFENLQFMYNTAKTLVGDFNWSVCAGGRMQMPLCTLAMNMGGNVRVGLEDSLLLEQGSPCQEQRRAGGEDRAHRAGVRSRTSHLRRGRDDAGPQGSRQGQLVGANGETCIRGWAYDWMGGTLDVESIKKVLVIGGTGTMGQGIAQNFAEAGIEVIITGRSDESCDRALTQIEANCVLMDEYGLLRGRAGDDEGPHHPPSPLRTTRPWPTAATTSWKPSPRTLS